MTIVNVNKVIPWSTDTIVTKVTQQNTHIKPTGRQQMTAVKVNKGNAMDTKQMQQKTKR